MPPYCYPYQMHPQMTAEAIPGVSGYGAPPYVRPPINPPPKVCVYPLSLCLCGELV